MYAIIRAEKTKRSGIAGKNSHNMRLRETPNADPKRKDLNEILIGTGDLKTDLQNRIDETNAFIRNKETVVSTELILTASPEFFEKNDPKKNREWVDEQVNFLKSEYGDNCINAVLHLDETTPHIHAFITPIVENEKNNRMEFNNKGYFGIGGYKTLQNKYFSHNEKFGLKRGVEKNTTASNHKDVKSFYGDINTDAKKSKYIDQNLKIEEFKPEEEKNFIGMTKQKPITPEDVNNHTRKAVKTHRRAYKKVKAVNKTLARENEDLKARIESKDSNLVMETERKYIGKINELETQNQTKQSELNQTKRSLNDANSRISKLEEFKDTVEEKILNPVKKYFEKEFTALVKMAQRKEFEDKVSEGFESNKQELEQEPTKKKNNLPSFKPKTPFDRSEG
ncbi:TPA: hypothetical protein MB357_005327 [Klebsiella variicola subsp. variicola]|nr:hypothetical protein [Klebsiella variicola subsp. variicola]